MSGARLHHAKLVLRSQFCSARHGCPRCCCGSAGCEVVRSVHGRPGAGTLAALDWRCATALLMLHALPCHGGPGRPTSRTLAPPLLAGWLVKPGLHVELPFLRGAPCEREGQCQALCCMHAKGPPTRTHAPTDCAAVAGTLWK